MIPAKSFKSYLLEFYVKMSKMTLVVKVNEPYFQYQPRVYYDACFQLKYVTSYRADKVKFTDGPTDGRTDGRTDWRRLRHCPFGLKGKGVKII